jgi:hypothetical protein
MRTPHRLDRLAAAGAIALVLAGALALSAATACSKPDEPPAPPAPASPASPSPAAPASVAAASPPSPPAPANPSALPLQWSDPPRWTRRRPSSAMRIAEYGVPHVAGDTADAECTVITFGAGQGGNIDDNIGRWVKQFSPVSGEPAKAIGTVNGLKVTRVEVAGAYHPMQMPGAPSAPAALDHARLIGAIVEAPSGLWFFKLTGPDATVKSAATDFDAMMSSLHATAR